jgi:energy-coupling factor transport system ATP-binding protein
MIRFDRFGWRFEGSPSQALRDISLEIRRGEFAAITGLSGSGKSTLAMAMCGLLVGRHAGEAEGTIRVGGRDVAAAPLHDIAKTIGLVQQNPDAQFATLTVSDEVAFGMENRCVEPDVIRERCAEAFDLLSITHLRDRELASLSGGEKQRVAVASLVAGKPEALVLDEPSASLDPDASRSLFRALADLCRRAGLTVVIIEHKLTHLLPLQPRLIGLKGGRVDEDAPARNGNTPHTTCLRPAATARAQRRTVDAVPPERDCIVEVSDVTVELDGRTVLDNVSLQVGAGEVVGIMGPNGGGKTTLLSCLLGLVRPLRGSIRVCGIEVAPDRLSRLVKHVGLVFQNADHQLVADTVWREVIFAARHLKALDAAARDLGVELLEQAGLSARKDAHPYRLSWGEKRRLNLISAILHRARLILLDEPFAGQDWENVAFQLEALRAALEGPPELAERRADVSPPPRRGACLVVTHDSRAALRACTRLLFVADGRVTLDGAVPQVFERFMECGHDAYVPREYASAPMAKQASPAMHEESA